MAQEIEIIIDSTRWKEDNVNFVVKDSVPGKFDTWKVLQTSLSLGINYSWRKKSGPKFLELSGDEIRRRCADYVAEIATKQMTVSGVHLNAMGHQKHLVVRNGKANVSRIHESLRRIKERGFVPQN